MTGILPTGGSFWLGVSLSLLLFSAGFLTGVVAGEYATKQTPEEMQRDYDAYRECIPKPGCMKAADYLDYYDLKWALEDEH